MIVKYLMDVLIPPADASPALLIRWRYAVGASLTIIIGCIACLYMITARASDVNELKAAVYIPTIQQIHEKRCLTEDEELRHVLAQTLNQYQQKYKEATGEIFPLEDCKAIRERKG